MFDFRHATRHFGSGQKVASVASINAARKSGGCCKPIPVGAGMESQKTSNFRLFEALKQALEGVKTVAYNLIKTCKKKHKIRLESTSCQGKTHLQKNTDSNLFLLQKTIQEKTNFFDWHCVSMLT